ACDVRLRFLRGLKTWATFGKGWSARVEGVRRDAVHMANAVVLPHVTETPKTEHENQIMLIIRAILNMIKGK
ncbi:hypothetical protein, partial [Streptococcus pneumoniae]|uniref:hypothetical protein n=1 Tax=Streptococcus pneumoniae TaxID=1313 RepID=UPI001E53AA01